MGLVAHPSVSLISQSGLRRRVINRFLSDPSNPSEAEDSAQSEADAELAAMLYRGSCEPLARVDSSTLSRVLMAGQLVLGVKA